MKINDPLQIIDERTVLGNTVRIYGSFEEPLYLARDVARLLGYRRACEMTPLAGRGQKTLAPVDAGAEARRMTLLTEAGLRSVLNRSLLAARKPPQALEELFITPCEDEPGADLEKDVSGAAFHQEACGLAQARGRLAELTADLGVTERDGRVVVSSLDVAKNFGKEHRNIIRSIKSLDPHDGFIELNFELNEYQDIIGRKLPCYFMSRDGFMLLIMAFTGKKAEAIKVAYIRAFNAMEAALRERSGMPPAALEALTASVTQITTAVTELARRMVDFADVLAAVARRQDDVERRCAALERRLQGSPQPRPETAQIPLFTEPRELLTEARKALDKPAREPLVPPDIETKRPYTGIGVRLRRLRQHLDRTPDELAAMIRMSGGAYKNVELGINRPSLLTLTKLREATGVSADWLLFGHGAMFGAERDAE